MGVDSEDATSQSLLNTEYDQLIGGEDEIAATARTIGWQVNNNFHNHNNSKDRQNRRIH